ncbi:MAG TPA: HAMP domain-containing sensor histidine kinase [Candidatus Dormibacteraeota bacterium]
MALGLVIAEELNSDIQQRYIASGKTSATLIAQAGIQPLLTEQDMANGLSPAQVDEINQRLHGAAISADVRRIKVWNRAGTVIYSDNPSLIGRTFTIDDDLEGALRGVASASVTDGHDEENSGDTLAGPLIQVYAPLIFPGNISASGAFELYLPYAPVQAAIDAESHQLDALLAVGLVLFYASMFPIVALAERWRRSAEATAIANVETQERLNRLKSQFLIRISHQFRTALVGIEGFSEVIRDSESLDLEEVKAFAADIHSDAERLDRAFSQMLTLDQMEAGRASLDITAVDINKMVRDVAVQHDRVTVTTPGSGAITVMCDRGRIEQLLTIIVDNAIKYSPARSDVEVNVVQRGADVEVTVKDHGPGMQENGNAPTMTNGNGNGAGATGLGLPIAREIVRMHGGRIWFVSKPAQGTQVHFTLPMTAVVTVAKAGSAA